MGSRRVGNTSASIKSRLVPKSIWCPISLSRKLPWRLRQCTIWEMILSVAFVLATVIFFSALTGMGHRGPDPMDVASGWHTTGSAVFRYGMTKPSTASSDILQTFLQLAGPGGRSTDVDAHNTGTEGILHIVVDEATDQRNHVYHPDRPRLGAVPKTRQRGRRIGDDSSPAPFFVNLPAVTPYDTDLSAEEGSSLLYADRRRTTDEHQNDQAVSDTLNN